MNDFLKNLKLRYCAISTSGRTGSDYLNGCLHGLDKIITINAPLFFFRQFLKKNSFEDNQINTKLILDSFCKFYENKIFGNDVMENKVFSKNSEEYKNEFNKIYQEEMIGIQNFFIFSHLAYHKLYGGKFFDDNLIVYHAHGMGEMFEFTKFFPSSVIILTVRDPRDNLKSSFINHSTYFKEKKKNLFFYRFLTRPLHDFYKTKNEFNQKKFFMKLEEANDLTTKLDLCNFLNIEFNDKIFISSYADNKPYLGDKLSKNNQPDGKYKLVKGSWKNFFFQYEKFILNYIYQDHLIYFNYEHSKIKKIHSLIFLFIMILPFRIELKNFLNIKNIKSNLIYYLKKIMFFIDMYNKKKN